MSLRTEVVSARIREDHSEIVLLPAVDLVRVTGGDDFSDIRMHVGSAAASASSIGAAAYTPGSLISLAGSLVTLIAHELMH